MPPLRITGATSPGPRALARSSGRGGVEATWIATARSNASGAIEASCRATARSNASASPCCRRHRRHRVGLPGRSASPTLGRSARERLLCPIPPSASEAIAGHRVPCVRRQAALLADLSASDSLSSSLPGSDRSVRSTTARIAPGTCKSDVAGLQAVVATDSMSADTGPAGRSLPRAGLSGSAARGNVVLLMSLLVPTWGGSSSATG